MITIVEPKRPDYAFVERVLGAADDANHWTNFGPVSRQLEATVESLLGLPDDRRAVACASGTVALHGLAGLYGFIGGRPLRWVVSAFTFACQRQGPLAGSIVVDCASDGALDLDAVAELERSSYDGVIVTNLFGGSCGAERWVEFAQDQGKRLIFDSAASFYTGATALEQWGSGEAFSFHHTKPCGFGEGGCAVVPTEHEQTFRSLINFGRYAGIDTGEFSMNGKLSDAAAAFILDRLRSAETIRTTHRREWQRITSAGKQCGLDVIGSDDPGFPSVAALSAPYPVAAGPIAVGGESAAIVPQKMYPPLDPAAGRARDIYERAICLPCQSGMARFGDRDLEAALAALLDSSPAEHDAAPEPSTR